MGDLWLADVGQDGWEDVQPGNGFGPAELWLAVF